MVRKTSEIELTGITHCPDCGMSEEKFRFRMEKAKHSKKDVAAKLHSIEAPGLKWVCSQCGGESHCTSLWDNDAKQPIEVTV